MANVNQLLETLAKQLNIPKDRLQAAIQSGDPQAVAALLSGKQAQAFQKVMSDPQAAKNLLNSKEAQTLQKQFES